ncbi:lipase family protein [Nocardia sp. CDC153]|uniref:lipase family protein n=1 Tax=Nocardia sp. CDC153 TaxID=3112167 RepID=UPI002DB77CD3|nr:lipase family protein [Nocardia sp. CDC153]MEC3953538.1 lipase family protein [Nocardia sp. CDC153]
MSGHGWGRLLAAGAAAALLLAVQATAYAEETKDIAVEPPPAVTLPPEVDDFYSPPAGQVAAARPGEILRARRINPAYFGFVQLNIDAWQLSYRTTNSFGAAISTVTTVLVPRGPAPEGGRKLLSYQIAEDSAAQYCAPSYVIQSGALPLDYVNAAETMIPIAAGVGQGWTVVIPDYEGPHSSYGTSKLNAQATLDGIRAAESFSPAQLSGTATPTALWGYSGGTVPSSFAAEIAKDYAPELNIAGVAAGGIAAADYPTALRHNNRGLYTGLVMGVFAGIAGEYPEVRDMLRDNVVDPVTQLLLASKQLLCHPTGTALVPFYDYLGAFGYQGDPLQHPAVQRFLAENSLGQRTPSMPIYIYHAQYDEILPNAGVDRLVDKYCGEGAPSVVYERELVAEHISGFAGQLPGAFGWLRDRLDGVPAPEGCTITDPTLILAEPRFWQTLGEILPTAVQALVGQAIGAGK